MQRAVNVFRMVCRWCSGFCPCSTATSRPPSPIFCLHAHTRRRLRPKSTSRRSRTAWPSSRRSIAICANRSTEQNNSLKRVEDQLEMVREATDRNTLEQQELLEDLKTFSNKVKVVAVIAIGLLAVGFVLNLILFLHIQRVLP